MSRFIAAFLLISLLPVPVAVAEDCSLPRYTFLVAEGKSAAEGRDWGKSVEIYSRIIADCHSLVAESDQAKVYDALSTGQLMQVNYSVAMESAKKCLEHDPRYNACMMTAAKACEGLGDREMARAFARSAVEVGAYDDYSAAVVIFARDFLKKLDKREQSGL